MLTWVMFALNFVSMGLSPLNVVLAVGVFISLRTLLVLIKIPHFEMSCVSRQIRDSFTNLIMKIAYRFQKTWRNLPRSCSAGFEGFRIWRRQNSWNESICYCKFILFYKYLCMVANFMSHLVCRIKCFE